MSETQSGSHGVYWCQTSDSIATIGSVPFEVRAKAKEPLGNEHIVHRLRRLFGGPTLQFLGGSIFNLCWMKWQWDRFCSENFGFLLSVSFHQCCTLILIYMMLLPGGKTDEAWEWSERQYRFRNRGAVYRKVFRNIMHQVVFCVCCYLDLKKE